MTRTPATNTDPKNSAAWLAYVQSRDRVARIRELERMRKDGARMPICVAEDLLLLDIGLDEKCAILELTGSQDPRALEHFLTQYLFEWPQDLAALAVRTWASRTDHLLWFRLVAHCTAIHLPQRVLYTILDLAHASGGARLIERAAGVEGLAGLSSAFQGLLLHRAVQWSTPLPALATLAREILHDLKAHYHPEHKAMPSAIAYMLRFHADEAASEFGGLRESPWREILLALLKGRDQVESQADKLGKLFTKQGHGDQGKKLAELWPSLWCRDALPLETVRETMRLVFTYEQESEALSAEKPSWDSFAGIPEPTLAGALLCLEDDLTLARALCGLHPLLKLPYAGGIVEALRKRLAATADPGAILHLLPLRLRLELTEAGAKPDHWTALKTEETATLAAIESGSAMDRLPRAELHDWTPAEGTSDLLGAVNVSRKAFFDHAYRGRTPEDTAKANANGFWELMRGSWTKPSGQVLPQLAQSARQVEGIFRLCYIATLGRFHGEDQAALKLLDFIRTKDEDELRAVVCALAGIGTPRALQELVATLTRPNVTTALQLEICALLAKADVGNLQSEIRSAIKDVIEKGSGSASVDEVREAMAGLLSPVTTEALPVQARSGGPQSDAQLDAALAAKIPYYKELSSEVKRALRTSQFFHVQVSVDDAPESIDLSPVIDMQYKALELLFREGFEDHCSRVIHRGVLQRRLDVIGYARPIPRAMDEFENYIGSLPVIRDIPFFSKFKLRKMLRAICQFRPGKRFTLDGLKAFALFFLCFGRSQCRHGLNGIITLGFKDDMALFEFVKTLHVMQDFRNRAAHEGFHPDASNDIDGIWRDTAQIVQTMFETRKFLDQASMAEYAPKPRADAPKPVIIERKKVS